MADGAENETKWSLMGKTMEAISNLGISGAMLSDFGLTSFIVWPDNYAFRKLSHRNVPIEPYFCFETSPQLGFQRCVETGSA